MEKPNLNAVSPDFAEREFSRWALASEIETDPAQYDDADQAELVRTATKLFIRGMAMGKIEVDDDGTATFRATKSGLDDDRFVIRTPTADLLQIMQNAANRSGKMYGSGKSAQFIPDEAVGAYAMIAACTERTKEDVRKLTTKEFKMLSAILGLFTV